jgi:hypothetical protein
MCSKCARGTTSDGSRLPTEGSERRFDKIKNKRGQPGSASLLRVALLLLVRPKQMPPQPPAAQPTAGGSGGGGAIDPRALLLLVLLA